MVGPGGFPGTPEQFQTLLPIAVAVMIAGPSIAGLVFTGLVHGRAGLREFGSRLLNWLSPISAASIFSGLAIALGAGIFEELGWTGFAIPELRKNTGRLGPE